MRKAILVSMIAVFAVLALIVPALASTGSLVSDLEVSVNGAESQPFALEAGDTILAKVVFKAVVNVSDVRISGWIDGYRNDISDKTDRFELVEGNVYVKYLSMQVPSDIDLTEDSVLQVRIANGAQSDETEISLGLQRSSYELEIISAETADKVSPGTLMAVDVVIKNRGMHDLEDVFVNAQIPELGIEKKVYFGDVNPLDQCEIDSDSNCDRGDAIERRLYLTIPEDAKAGTYTVEIEAYNSDASTSVKKTLLVSRVEASSNALAGIASKSVSIGEEVTYDLILVNAGSKMKLYTLTPDSAEGMIVTVDPIVSVPADSSREVTVRVKATDSAKEETHTLNIRVESEGELVKTVALSANVEKASVVTSSVTVLTIVLVIVFVVLLIILIVLLTRKPASMEAEESSYY